MFHPNTVTIKLVQQITRLRRRFWAAMVSSLLLLVFMGCRESSPVPSSALSPTEGISHPAESLSADGTGAAGQQFEDIAPWPTTSWSTASPADVGANSQLLNRMLIEIEQQVLPIYSLVVVHRGYIIAEAYYPPFGQDTIQETYSCTKSVMSALVGIAIDDELIGSVHDPMLGYFPDRLINNNTQLKRAISIEHLLTMTAGLHWDFDAMVASADWVQYVLDQPMNSIPGSTFFYSSGNTHLLSAIIMQTSGISTLDYARARLFEPLGILALRWDDDVTGLPNGGWGLALTARDMAKLGYLYLRHGRWEEKQIVPEEWIRASTSEHAQVPEPLEPWDLYMGYLWWLHGDGVFAAHGTRGKFIYVMPSSDLVVVLTADVPDARFVELQMLIRDYIIPAVDRVE